MKIAVIGQSGQLARELMKLQTTTCKIVCMGRNEVDVSNKKDLMQKLQKSSFTGVINAAAYNKVDQAEREPDQAFELNDLFVNHLLQVCQSLNIPLIHVSTNYVFDGTKQRPYLPEDSTNPINVYGKSKLSGENRILCSQYKKVTILRSAGLYSSEGQNFVLTMLLNMLKSKQLRVVCDHKTSITAAHELAKMSIIALKNQMYGLHHCVDDGSVSWFEFAQTIQRLAHSKDLIQEIKPIQQIQAANYDNLAQRPPYSVLDASGFYAITNQTSSHWKVQLNMVLDQIKTKGLVL